MKLFNRKNKSNYTHIYSEKQIERKNLPKEEYYLTYFVLLTPFINSFYGNIETVKCNINSYINEIYRACNEEYRAKYIEGQSFTVLGINSLLIDRYNEIQNEYNELRKMSFDVAVEIMKNFDIACKNNPEISFDGFINKLENDKNFIIKAKKTPEYESAFIKLGDIVNGLKLVRHAYLISLEHGESSFYNPLGLIYDSDLKSLVEEDYISDLPKFDVEKFSGEEYFTYEVELKQQLNIYCKKHNLNMIKVFDEEKEKECYKVFQCISIMKRVNYKKSPEEMSV